MLADKDCWQVMRQRAFSNGNINEEENLEQLGKAIAAECNGLPLAAKTLGNVLRFKFDEESWRLILENELWDLPQEKNDIIPALALSYHHLPAHLKKCFAYCSLFPRNYVFEVDDLVLQWMAEGFLKPTGKRKLEDIGRDYFMDLLNRSFFQCAEGDLNNPKLCRMHDLIHSMAQSVSEGICFRMEDNISPWYPLYRNVRHLSLSHDSMELIAQTAFPQYQSLRTFILLCRSGIRIQKLRYDLLLRFRSLRVLNLSNAGIDELPDSIDHLKHLRYLNLSQNEVKRLPRAITKLLRLQTLKLINCYKFLEFPLNLMNLTNLRHIHLNIWRLNCMPPNLGRLTNLQTLQTFIVGREQGYGIDELEKMGFLKGSLLIRNLEKVPNLTEAKKANLGGKPCLDKLELEWTDAHCNSGQDLVLEGLEPHVNLKKLVIKKYSGRIFPRWLSSRQHKFTSIYLQSCGFCICLPPLGQLPVLKLLHIEGMSSLVQIDDRFCSWGDYRGFPSLESLTFQKMPELIEWNGLRDNDLPCLRDLTFEDCPKLIALPYLYNLRSLEKLRIKNCSSLQSLPEQLPHALRHLIISDIAHLREWNSLAVNELPHLQYLIVGNCPSLICLPSLNNIHSLQELKIICCPELQSLPELPHSLRNLIILDCPTIKERCAMGEEDWLRLRSIERVEIDGEEIQSSAQVV